jgi:hypothetical protein
MPIIVRQHYSITQVGAVSHVLLHNGCQSGLRQHASGILDEVECVLDALREAASTGRGSELMILLSHLNVIVAALAESYRDTRRIAESMGRGERMPPSLGTFGSLLLSTVIDAIGAAMCEGRHETVSTLFDWLKERNRDRVRRLFVRCPVNTPITIVTRSAPDSISCGITRGTLTTLPGADAEAKWREVIATACITRYEELMSDEIACPSLLPHAMERARGSSLSLFHLIPHISVEAVPVIPLCEAIGRSRSIPLIHLLSSLPFEGRPVPLMAEMFFAASKCHWEEGVIEVLNSGHDVSCMSWLSLATTMASEGPVFSFSLFTLLLRRFEAECSESIARGMDPRHMIVVIRDAAGACREKKVRERYSETAARRGWPLA